MKTISPDEGLEFSLTQVLESRHIRLGTNSLTIDRDTVFADLTEAAWTGYAPVAMAGNQWSYHLGLLMPHEMVAICDPVTFQNNSGAQVTATFWFVTPAASDELLFIAQFDSPQDIADAGELTFNPVTGCRSRYSQSD